jgi:sugar-specific transcriptional regulator TrmB
MSDSNLIKDVNIITSYGAAEALSKFLSETRTSLVIHFEQDFVPVIGPDGIIRKIARFPKDVVTIRTITNVTEQNISSYERNKHMEVRHMKDVQGNFIIFDQKNYIHFLSSNNVSPRILIISNGSFVRSQLQLFSCEWKLASTLSERRKELGETSEEFTRIITNPYQIIEELKISIKLANEEILLLCSTSNAASMLERAGILFLLQKAACREVTVKMIVHVEDNETRDKVKSIYKEKFPNISFQPMRKQLQTKIMSMVIDKQEFIAVHTDDVADKLEDFIHSCTYSNNQLKLSSAISLLESLWIQSSFDNQNIIKQAYFQMFKGFNLKEETYKREWSFDNKNENKEGVED